MAQSATKADQIQIEPGSTGTRLISRDSSTGGLLFTDPANPTGVLLSDLTGLKSLGFVYTVGTGVGATYATIQDAIDAVDYSSTDNNLILIAPGTYTENILIDKDNLYLCGLGRVIITNSAIDHTITVTQSSGDTPKYLKMENLTVYNTADGKACIRLNGANTYATGSVTVVSAPRTAGDTITIGGVVLTGVAGARTSGSNNFNSALLTVNAIAAEIALAINDPLNSFFASVFAVAIGAGVIISAQSPGAAGNLITLASVTTPGAQFTLSGATLLGGGGADSLLGQTGIEIKNCSLVATGNGGYQVDADTVNYVSIDGGTWYGSSSSSLSRVVQVASFKVQNVGWTNDFEVAYDVGNDQPIVITSEWSLNNIPRVKDLLINLIGAGSTTITNCPSVGDMIHNGDQTLTMVSSRMGTLTIEDTVVGQLINTTRTGLAGAGTPTLVETTFSGSVSFVASASEVIPFVRDQPDTNYAVYTDCPVLGFVVQVTAKTTSDFTLSTLAPITATVLYTVVRYVS